MCFPSAYTKKQEHALCVQTAFLIIGWLMNIRIRTSLIAILITVCLTILKFVFYYFSGSIAVLSEAWHSGSDIATSLLVLCALFRKTAIQNTELPDEIATEPSRQGKFKTLWWVIRTMFGKHIEVTTSLIIGLFLTTVATMLIINVFLQKNVKIENPLVTGIIFLVLSLGSYFLFNFLSSVGKSEHSAALISDGLHSKGDMVCSSLTGTSLILYYFGFDCDRWVSLIIALFILSFGIEIIINVVAYFVKKDTDFELCLSSINILYALFNKASYHHFFNWILDTLKINSMTSAKIKQLTARTIKFCQYTGLILFMLGIGYNTGFQVQMDEEAIVERFGKPVQQESLQPGLHFKFPWPIDTVRKNKTRQVRELLLGNVAVGEQKPLIWGTKHGEEVHFISGDNNFFDPYIIIQYRIKNLYDYYYNSSSPDTLVENFSYKTLQKVFTTKSFYELSIANRSKIETSVQDILQNDLDKIRTGIDIIGVNLKDIHPPIKISKSFEEVIASYQKKEEMINLALEYRNSEIPSSRGMAYNDVTNAKAYINEEVLKAQGAITSFHAKLEPYLSEKEIVRKVLYFNYIEETLKQNDKVIIDPKTGHPSLYISAKNAQSTINLPVE